MVPPHHTYYLPDGSEAFLFIVVLLGALTRESFQLDIDPPNKELSSQKHQSTYLQSRLSAPLITEKL